MGTLPVKEALFMPMYLTWPESGEIVIDKSVKVTKAYLLADSDKKMEVKTSREGDAIIITRGCA
jgi:hypothetical protein